LYAAAAGRKLAGARITLVGPRARLDNHAIGHRLLSRRSAVLLYEPDATPLDLRFRLFGTYVRVNPLFWLIMAIFGWRYTRNPVPVLPGGGMGDLALWVLCGFVSVLLHEFGHVWMGRLFGTHGHILLHSMGGLAIGASDVPYRWQRILISLAGPGIQLLLFAALVGLLFTGVISRPLLDDNPALALMLNMLLMINLWWPLLNLLPIFPLDGGQVTREVCQIVSPNRGLVVSLWVSLFAAILLAANALVVEQTEQRVALIPYVGHLFGGYYLAILFALLAYGSWQALQEENSRRRRYWDDDLPWER
jgi:Zn-dependent protease